MANAIERSVVSIGTDSRGSGFVVAPARVLTNAHHLRDRTTSVRFAEVASCRGASPAATPTATSSSSRWTPPTSRRSPGPRSTSGVGDVVFGASRDHESVSITSGQISAVARPPSPGREAAAVRGGVEHTMPLRRGASGGPLLDARGAVVGINTHRLRGGFYLARATDAGLRGLVERLAAGESVERVRLGVALATTDVTRKLRASVGLDAIDGLLVRGVEEGGRAAAAGVRVGDVLVRAGNVELTTPDALLDVIDAAGDVLELSLVRGAESLQLAVALSEPPET